MSDIETNSAAIRREARKKRILENSESRLRRIADTALSEQSVSKVVLEPEIIEPLSSKSSELDFPKCTQNESVDTIEFNTKFNEYLNGERAERDIEPPLQKEPVIDCTPVNFIVTRRLHYVFLAIVVHILLHYKFGFLFYENIVCPFYTIKILEYFMSWGNQREIHPNIFLLLCGIPSNVLVAAQRVYITTSTLISDFALYFFIFMLCNLLVNGNGIKHINQEI